MGKVIAREFIWLMVGLIAAIPLGIVFLWFFGFTSEIINLSEIRKNYIFWLYLIGYFTSFVGIYIIRFVSMALKSLTAPEEELEEE
ncbi:hypothetical protein [Aureispira anguillae]|uniref:Uncharacterized protein n=1 Tax=Aureispira anguillae TaxID=2864201 RepID=A0A916DUB6_9BACT|nr:hypothetical protein [Aureispira anguillae]BDS14004.1 hypothetical protein AsAng_0047670 [Aureispira anguillae]